MDTLKPGTLMEITGNSNYHNFRIGEIVRVVRYDLLDGYECEHLDGRDYWFVVDCDMKPFVAKPKVYLCLCDDGDWIAYEGDLDDLPSSVVRVWEPGVELVKTIKWEKKDA